MDQKNDDCTSEREILDILTLFVLCCPIDK